MAYPWRYLAGADLARELLENRRIAVVRGVCQAPVPPAGWRRRKESSGGQMVLEATDLLDMARCFGGELAAISAVRFQGIIAARVSDYDIEDAIAAAIRFCTGAVGELIVTNISPRPESALTIIADDLELRLTEEALEVVEPGKRTTLQHPEPGLLACQRSFLEAVRTGDAKLVRTPYAEAVRTLEAALAANKSAESGNVIVL